MLKIFEEQELFEMANIPKAQSGLGSTIWIDSYGKKRSVGHNKPRIKVGENPNALIPVSISKDPEILVDGKTIKNKRKIFKFISDNYETLMKHWNGELSDFEALTELYKYIKDNN